MLISIFSKDSKVQTDVDLKATSGPSWRFLRASHGRHHNVRNQRGGHNLRPLEGLLLDACVTHPHLERSSSLQTKGLPRFEGALEAACERVCGAGPVPKAQTLKEDLTSSRS